MLRDANKNEYSKVKLIIAMPTYNRPAEALRTYRVIKKSIELAKLSLREVRFAIFNNASTVDGYEKLKSEANENGDFYFCNSKNVGLVKNLYCCIKSAEDYDYLWMLGDDDEYDSEIVGEVLSKIVSEQPGLLFINHSASYKGTSNMALNMAFPINENLSLLQIYRYSGTTMMFIGACVYRVEMIKEAIKKDKLQRDRLTVPFYWSFYCAQFGLSKINNIYINNIRGDVSWSEHMDEVFNIQLPLDILNLCGLKISFLEKLIAVSIFLKIKIRYMLKNILISFGLK